LKTVFTAEDAENAEEFKGLCAERQERLVTWSARAGRGLW